MSAPTLVVMGSVTQGSINSPTTIWIYSVRNLVTDTSIESVRQFENELTSNADVTLSFQCINVGMIVAVKRADKFVRGKVEQITTANNKCTVRLFMVDWGEVVEEILDNLRVIPNKIKMPGPVLADRLVVWKDGLPDEELKMVTDIVEECRLGWLGGVGCSESGNFATGQLTVKITPDMQVMKNYKDRLLGRLVGEMVRMDSLVGWGNVNEKMKTYEDPSTEHDTVEKLTSETAATDVSKLSAAPGQVTQRPVHSDSDASLRLNLSEDGTDEIPASPSLQPVLMEPEDSEGYFLIGEESQCNQKYSLSINISSIENLNLVQSNCSSFGSPLSFQFDLLGVSIATSEFSVDNPNITEKIIATLSSNRQFMMQFMSSAKVVVKVCQEHNVLASADVNLGLIVPIDGHLGDNMAIEVIASMVLTGSIASSRLGAEDSAKIGLIIKLDRMIDEDTIANPTGTSSNGGVEQVPINRQTMDDLEEVANSSHSRVSVIVTKATAEATYT